MVGIYKVYLKSKPERFQIVGSANIEAYMAILNDKNYEYRLIRECNKLDLKRYEEHFIERFKSKEKKEKPVKVLVEETPEEMETAVIDEPVMEKAVIKTLELKEDIDSETLSNLFSVGDFRKHPVLRQVRDMVATKETRK